MQHQLSVHWCVDNPITFTLESWAEIDIVINRFTDNGVSPLSSHYSSPLSGPSIVMGPIHPSPESKDY